MFFFFKQKTAYEMRISDWSSDVCSSDLLLASLRGPEPPRGLRNALATVSMLKNALWDMSPKTVKNAPCQEIVLEGDDVDLNQIPLQRCWPGDVAPLLTWGLVITDRKSGV